MTMTITGKIIEVLPMTSGTSKSGKEWKKVEFLLETIEQYSKKVLITVFGNKVDECGQYLTVGNEVSANFDLSSNEWTSPQGKRSFFTSVNAYSVIPTAMAGGIPQQTQPQAVAQTNPSQQPSAFEQAQMVYSNPAPSNPPTPQDPFANQSQSTSTDDLPF